MILSRVLAIAAFTLLPLAGVLFLGWDWREIILLYWFENVSLGVAMFVRLLRSSRRDGAASIAVAFFFAVHYGIFALVHGVFVIAIVNGAFAPMSSAAVMSPLDWPGILLVWAIGGALQIAAASIMPIPQAVGAKLMMSAYPRVIVLHAVILGSAFVIASLGLPAVAAVALIVVHAIVDGVGWATAARREGAARRPAGTDPGVADGGDELSPRS